MLWLIWIALMLAVPTFAGLQLWLDIRRETEETPPVSASQPNDRLAA